MGGKPEHHNPKEKRPQDKTMETDRALKDLMESAPRPLNGPPSADQMKEQQDFKTKVKEFLATLPENSGHSFNSLMKQVKTKYASPPKRQAAQPPQQKKKEKQPRPLTAAGTPEGKNEKPVHMVDYLCVLDFEATCNDGPPPTPQEIIEFPTLLLNVQTGQVEDEFHFYIKPDVHSVLSTFCTDLTGITQDTVGKGISLEEALKLHQEWLEKYKLIITDNSPDRKRFLYVTCGDWDLKTCLPNQLAHHGIDVPGFFDSWININWPFQKLYKARARGMVGMLKTLGLELEGRHHSGIDDCRNLARICANMLKDGWVPESTGGSSVVGTVQFWKHQRRRLQATTRDAAAHDRCKKVFLIRHGQSMGQVSRYKKLGLDDSILRDCELSEAGIIQARKIPEALGLLNTEEIDCVISSPLRRALHTALLAFPSKPITVHYDLSESGADIPENSAIPMNEVLKSLAAVLESRSAPLGFSSLQPSGWPNPTFREAHRERIKKAFQWMYEERSESAIAVVCHYNVIRTVLQEKKGTVSAENGVPIQCWLFPDGKLVPA